METTKDYRHITFLQGDAALPTLELIESGALSGKDLLYYLLQFDTCNACRITDYNPAGETDTIETHTSDNKTFEIAINHKLGYIGLCEII